MWSGNSPKEMTMKKTILLSLLTAAMLPLAASGQEQAQPLTKADATQLFHRIDVNKDQLATKAEVRPHGLVGPKFTAYDHNSDGQMSESEFLVAYRAMAEGSGRPIARDLAQQVSRIRVAQRAAAKEAAEIKQKRAKHKRLQQAREANEAARKEAQRKAEAQRKRAEAQRKQAERIRQARQKEDRRPSRRKP